MNVISAYIRLLQALNLKLVVGFLLIVIPAAFLMYLALA